jgi:hypothetical protein
VPSTAPVREGLPAGYRMRADAHYVDQLVAPARRALDDEARPAAAAPAAPKAAAAVSKASSDLAMLNEDVVATSLSAVMSCTDLLADGMPRLTRSVAVDMIRAETQRAICALRTSHVLKNGAPVERRLIAPRTIVERVAETIAPESRLRGCRVTTTVEVADSIKLRVDEGTLVTALSSAALMLTAGLQELQGARLDLQVASTGANRVLLSLSQESVIVPEACLRIVNTAGEPGSAQTAPLVALRQVAEAYGGSASASRMPHGTQFAIELPAAEIV